MTTPHKALLIQARDALKQVVSNIYDETCATYLACAPTIADLQAAIDAPEPESVAWVLNGHFGAGNTQNLEPDVLHNLYTHPPAVREPLTRQALKAVIASVPEPDDDHVGKWVVAVCRAVEAAHGIGVKP